VVDGLGAGIPAGLNLYRATAPHAGFKILRRWGENRPLGCFVLPVGALQAIEAVDRMIGRIG
jgi:hypothetical protein